MAEAKKVEWRRECPRFGVVQAEHIRKMGPKVVLGKLDKVHFKDNSLGSFGIRKKYFEMGRGLGGKRNFISRYEKENYRMRRRWNRGKNGKNPTDRYGKITLCWICQSEWHWVRECPQNMKNVEHCQRKEKNEERVFVRKVSRVDDES